MFQGGRVLTERTLRNDEEIEQLRNELVYLRNSKNKSKLDSLLRINGGVIKLSEIHKMKKFLNERRQCMNCGFGCTYTLQDELGKFYCARWFGRIEGEKVRKRAIHTDGNLAVGTFDLPILFILLGFLSSIPYLETIKEFRLVPYRDTGYPDLMKSVAQIKLVQ